MKPKPNTPGLLRDLLFAVLLFAIVFLVTNCAPKAFPVGSPNPLDDPGQLEPTADERHDRNIATITGNPAY